MKINKLCYLSLMLAGFTLAGSFFASCGDNDKTPVANEPKLSGEISFNRSRIGAGQPVEVSFPIPDTSEEVSSLKLRYGTDPTNKVTIQNTQQTDGLLTATIYFNDASTYSVGVVGDYVFAYPDADGKTERQDVVTKTIEVVSCDVRNSFWSENQAETKLNFQGQTPSVDTTDKLMYSGSSLAPSFLGTLSVSSSETNVDYRYNENKLSEVHEGTIYKQSTIMSARLMASLYNKVKNIGLGVEDTKQRFWFVNDNNPEWDEQCNKLFNQWLEDANDIESLKKMDEIFMKGVTVNFTFALKNSNILFLFEYQPEKQISNATFSYAPNK